MSRSIALGLTLCVVLAWADTASAQVDVILAPQDPTATGLADGARIDLQNGCSTRNGLPGFPTITVNNSGTPLHTFRDKTVVPAQFGPSQILNNACGVTGGNKAFVLVFERARVNGVWFDCPMGDTTFHEVIAHLMEAGHAPSGNGITAPGQVVNGVAVPRAINESECNQVDINDGKPNYDENGNDRSPSNPGNSPILLDIGGRGTIRTTGVDDPVLFDIDAEGVKKTITWSAHGRKQAFLVLDLSGNGAIDDGSELFGTGTFLVDEGVQSEHGFQALAQYDSPARGGNRDGIIDADDAVWSRLRLWSDVNHDGVSRRQEVRTLDRYDVIALELDFIEIDDYDAEGNWHRFRGYFHMWTKIQGRWTVTRELMEDIFFQLIQ